MTFTSECKYENSLGFSRYGYALCTTAEQFEGKTSVLDTANVNPAKLSVPHELWKPTDEVSTTVSPTEPNPETAPAVPDSE